MRYHSLAQLKRVPIGTKFRLTQLVGATVIVGNAGNSTVQPLVDALRIVAKVTSSAILFKTERGASSLDFPKASEITFDAEGFTINWAEEYLPALRYAYVAEPEGETA